MNNLNERKNCASCRQQIEGTMVSALNNVYHPNCFLCSQCRQPISSVTFVVRSDQPWCSKCVEWDKRAAQPASGFRPPVTRQSSSSTSSSSGSSSATSSTTTSRSNSFNGLLCGICNGVIDGLEGGITTRTGSYHPGCFRCSICSASIADGQKFIEKDGKRFHSACYSAEAAPRCANCNGALIGGFVKANGKQYHSECFRCAECNAPLSGTYTMKDGKCFCSAKGCGGAVDSVFQRQKSQNTSNSHTANLNGKTNSSNATATLNRSTPSPTASAAGKRINFCFQCGAPASSGKFCGDCGVELRR